MKSLKLNWFLTSFFFSLRASSSSNCSCTFGVEHLQGVHLLAARNEFQRFVHDRTDRDRGAAAGVAVELGEHHAVEVEPVVELPCRVHGVLTRHGVHDEERFRGFHGGFDGRDLLHHRLVYGQTSGGIDDHDVERVLACVFYGVFGDLHRVFAALFGIYLDADLPSEHLQLVDGCRTVNVAGDQQHLPAFLALDERSQLA